MQAAEQALEQRRLAHDDVDEVDAAAVGRIAAARDADERRDGMRLVGQEDVLARREPPQREEGDEQDEPDRQQPPRGEEPHRMSLERVSAVGCAPARLSGKI